MNKLGKIGVVLGGYAAALFAASAVVEYRQMQTSAAENQASGGMYAFGDFLSFVATFGVVALVPTGLALYFLRPHAKFWTVLSIICLAIAATGPVAAIVVAAIPALQLQAPVWQIAVALGFLRLAGAPLLAIGFFACAAFAPTRRSRRALLLAAGIECAVIAYRLIHHFLPRMS